MPFGEKDKFSKLAANRKSIHPPTADVAQSKITDMKVDLIRKNTKGKESIFVWEKDVKDITFSERRELYKKQAKNYQNVDKNEVNVDKYFEALDEVLAISGLTEQDFDGLSMVEIDTVLGQVLMQYSGLSKNVIGD